MDASPSAGGFLPPLSPPASIGSTSTAKLLPDARRTILKPGSQKENNLFNWIDAQLETIESKVERRFEAVGSDRGTARRPANAGYASFGQVATDLNNVVDVIWVSGTPSIQIPFLLSVANKINDYVTRFTYSPRKLFPLLVKLDMAFASLLTGIDYESKAPLPNVNSMTMNVTEKVRLRSIVETARVGVVNASRKVHGSVSEVSGETDAEETATETETETEAENEDGMRGFFRDAADQEDWGLDMGRVYERTLDLLGGTLSSEPVSNNDEMDI